MLRSFPFCIVDELNHSGMPELNIRHQRFVLLRANPIVVRLFCVALTQRIDECKLSHDPIFGVDGIFKRKRVRSIVVRIVDRMADPVPRVLIFAVIELHESSANLSFFFFAITCGGGPCVSNKRRMLGVNLAPNPDLFTLVFANKDFSCTNILHA